MLDYCIIFVIEQSTLKDVIIEDSLFQTYYLPYLQNLYNPKARRVRVKAILPISVLTELQLNAKVIIRDKKYIIEEIKSNLTTGEVDLVLISNLTGTSNGTVTPAPAPSSGTTIVKGITVRHGVNGTPQGTATINAPASQFITTTPTLPTTLTDSENFEFVVPANTGAARTNTVAIDYYDEENALMYTEYLVIEQDSNASNLTGGGAQLLSNILDNLTT